MWFLIVSIPDLCHFSYFMSLFVSAVESGKKDSYKATDELLNLSSRLTGTNGSIQNLKKTYEQLISNLKPPYKNSPGPSSPRISADDKLKNENKALKDQVISLKHDKMMFEEILKATYYSKIESLKISIEGKDTEISHLKGDIDFKSSAIDKFFLKKESIIDKLIGCERALNEAKDEILSLKVNISLVLIRMKMTRLTGQLFQVDKKKAEVIRYVNWNFEH